MTTCTRSSMLGWQGLLLLDLFIILLFEISQHTI